MKTFQDFANRKNEAVKFRFDVFSQLLAIAVKPINTYPTIEDWQNADIALTNIRANFSKADYKAKKFIEAYNLADFETALSYWDFA